ncbi:TetR/AcrR family transcriptional regulator [Mesobacillus selenatarsenatis]|uniref:Transcriptional regulator, tetr family n=1 Tax=Mesobacillus selenatarsenatis (strain DSM 18680 / JCM 14380 / FERM P-15431 / SF-1) TaxID=1321606 RepID=A0A0A8X1Y6_MESS1|nr:TetR/AcrR family transcriptional regulator [Mesobacillus selenatarsenatis]GAM12161.1 transcriptional regulator, tetr family [Mesobacillus selenatarsenatis SF-1]
MKVDGKSKILAAARIVISQHGANRATVRAIAEEAGMSTGAIYHYYKNKDDIFYDLLDDSLSDSTRIAKGMLNEELAKDRVIKEIVQKTEERLKKDTENRLQYHFAHEILLGNEELQEKFTQKYQEWNLRIEEILINLYGLKETPLNKALSSWLLGAVDGVILQNLLEVNENTEEDMLEIFELLLDKGLPQFIQILNESK